MRLEGGYERSTSERVLPMIDRRSRERRAKLPNSWYLKYLECVIVIAIG